MKLSQIKTLTESQSSNVKNLDVTKFTVKDLEIAADNAGFTDVFEGYTQAVYGKFEEKTKSHKFFLLWENYDADDEEKPFCISTMHVELGKSGFIEADFGGAPLESDMTKDEAVKKLASYKGK